MKNILSTLSDHELVAIYQSNSNETYLETLISRYEKMLRKLSHAHTLKHPNTNLEDNLQNAKHGAIIAFNRFNTQSSTALSTFLHTTVYYHLLTCSENESFVNCPSNLREVKSYCAGKYDSDLNKKNKFEEKYRLFNEKDIEEFKKTNIVLSNTICVTEKLQDLTVYDENSTIDEIQVKLFIETLPEDDKRIVCMLMEGYSISKISKILSSSHQKISDKQIKKKLQSIQTLFV